MTQEQYNILSKYEDQFHTTIKSNYATGIQNSDFNIILKTYREITGDTYSYTSSCSACVLRLYRNCGNLYFQHQQELNTIVPDKKKSK